MGHAIGERVLLYGIQSADYIRASGHSGCVAMEASLQAKTGRIHDRTRTLRRKSDSLLHRGRRPYMSHSRHWRFDFAVMHNIPGPVIWRCLVHGLTQAPGGQNF